MNNDTLSNSAPMTLQVVYPADRSFGRVAFEVSFDDKPVGSGYARDGFTITVNTGTGVHSLRVKFGMLPPVESCYYIRFIHGGDYRAQVKFNRFSGLIAPNLGLPSEVVVRDSPFPISREHQLSSSRTISGPESSPGAATVFFRPLLGVRFPSGCVGCLSPMTTHRLVINTAFVTKGALFYAAGLLSPLMYIVAAVTGEAHKYEIPICADCLAQVPKEEVAKLLWGTPRFFASSWPLVTTPFMQREFEQGRVVLTFTNPQYGRLFLGLNVGRVFSSLEESFNPRSPHDANSGAKQ